MARSARAPPSRCWTGWTAIAAPSSPPRPSWCWRPAGDRLDVSPKGDPAGFVRIEDDHHLLIPDRPGNNRLDGLLNILRHPRVALIFLIPSVDETLRVNGHATIHDDADLCARC